MSPHFMQKFNNYRIKKCCQLLDTCFALRCWIGMKQDCSWVSINFRIFFLPFAINKNFNFSNR